MCKFVFWINPFFYATANLKIYFCQHLVSNWSRVSYFHATTYGKLILAISSPSLFVPASLAEADAKSERETTLPATVHSSTLPMHCIMCAQSHCSTPIHFLCNTQCVHMVEWCKSELLHALPDIMLILVKEWTTQCSLCKPEVTVV